MAYKGNLPQGIGNDTNALSTPQTPVIPVIPIIGKKKAPISGHNSVPPITSTGDGPVMAPVIPVTEAPAVAAPGEPQVEDMEVEHTEPGQSPPPSCPFCGGGLFWMSIVRTGAIICGACHPPASPGVVSKWVREGESCGE